MNKAEISQKELSGLLHAINCSRISMDEVLEHIENIPFAFQTELRMSEIVALRWSDINEEQENCIHVQRMESKEYEHMPDGSWGNPSISENKLVMRTSVPPMEITALTASRSP